MIRIGILGLGTVGQGLVKIIRESQLPIQITGIVDRSYQKKKEIIGNIPASDNYDFLLKNPETDIIVELMGGIDSALYVVREALDAGKTVVTANKFLLAEHGFALFSKAEENGVQIGYEAAVAGAIPIIRNLQTVFATEKVLLLEGILNGTTNYILTRMRREKKDYPLILQEAQKLGLAEADPTLDVSGMDATHKLALLTSLITGQWMEYHRIHTRGIENISLADVLWAEKMGYRIRLVAKSSQENGAIYSSVEPTLVGAGHHLFHVDMENNAISFTGKYSGPHLFVGKGAGSLPTAYSVLSDIMHFSQKRPAGSSVKMAYAQPASLADKANPFYLRFEVIDRPGVLAKISRILSEQQISIATVHQEACAEKPGEMVDLVIVTHQTRRQALQLALEEIRRLEEVADQYMVMPLDQPN